MRKPIPRTWPSRFSGAEQTGQAVSRGRRMADKLRRSGKANAAQLGDPAQRSTARSKATRSVSKCLTRCQTFGMSDI